MKKTIEAVGLLDVVAQVKSVVESGGEVDLESIQGARGENFYYFDSYDKDGNLETYQDVFGYVELVKTLAEIFKAGGSIDINSVGASGGRRNWVLFEADLSGHVEEEIIPESPIEEPEDVQEAEQPIDEVDASLAAVQFAEFHDIDLSLVEGSGKGGKITKPDVVAYFEKQQ